MTRPIRIEGDTAYVPLTHGYEAIIDAADVPLISGRDWHMKRFGRSEYAARTTKAKGRTFTVLMHRTIGVPPTGFIVDHIDGDGLNNRRRNLRVATKQENAFNQRIALNNISGFKGVSWSKWNNKWIAAITRGRRKLHLGYFVTPEAAYEAYCKASAELHGEFGRTA